LKTRKVLWKNLPPRKLPALLLQARLNTKSGEQFCFGGQNEKQFGELGHRMNSNQKLWFTLEITVDSEVSEAIEFALNELDALGTEINHLGKKPTEPLCVIGYFNEIPNEKFVQSQLNEALRIYGFSFDAIQKIDSRKIEDTDWLFEWKKHWKPTETKELIIAPSWETVENTDKIVIRIEPNMAFGTGTHETTRLCLQAIEENYTGGSFLDVGTGTGILTIAAAKIKSRVEGQDSRFKDLSTLDPRPSTLDPFWACDTDENSIRIARENAELNGVDGINFFVGSISGETPQFDFVCANLTADVILPLLPLLIEKTKKTLVLSGILKEQEDLIVSEMQKFGIEKPKIECSGEWISVLMENGKLNC
jgi:ribosomal protein L11 methyltransferase